MPLPTATWPDDVPVLSRGDVTLRAHRPGDAAAAVEQCTDPASVRWTTVPLGYDLATAQEWVGGPAGAGWADGSEHAFAVECTHPDGRRRFAGTVSLRDEGDGRAEVAYGLHPAVRGRGVAGTAVDLLLDHGFATGLETVVWWAEVGNAASRRVAWRAGFGFGGVMRRWLEHRGTHVDAWVATLHRGDPRTPTTAWVRPPVLTTERLQLRPLEESDADRIVEGVTDPTSRQYLPALPDPYGPDDAVAFVREVESGVHGPGWGVEHRDGGPLLGVVSVPRSTPRSAEIGYWTHPDARGRGVMTEAVGAVVDWILRDADDGGYGRARALVRVAEPNRASAGVALANGFQPTGRERSSEVLRDGRVVDMLVLDKVADAGS